MLGIVYGAVIASLCIRFIWIVKFFAEKKSVQQKGSDGMRNKMVWIWIIVGLNIYAQSARTIINVPLLIAQYKND